MLSATNIMTDLRLVLLFCLVTFGVSDSARCEPKNAVPDVAGFTKSIKPFLLKHCSDCHGPDAMEGDLTLHAIDPNLIEGPDIGTWRSVAERLVLGEMPPEGEPRPDPREREFLINWIKAELVKAGEDVSDIGAKLILPGHGNRVDHRALFSADPDTPTASPSRLWRLSPQIYVSYVPKVAGSRFHTAQAFSSSPAEGFKDYARLFVIDEPTVSQLLRNADAIVEYQCGSKGKQNKPLKEFVPLIKEGAKPSDEKVLAAIEKQFHLALLRPPTDEERARYLELYRSNVADAGQVAGAKATLAAILMSPEALYRVEIGRGEPDEHGRRMLAPRELAYAIAFALTDEPPDAKLLAAAEKGRLETRADVRREVERILDDPKIETPRITRFFREYFEYAAVEDVFKDVEPPTFWPPHVLVNDTETLIARILERDRDVLGELLTTNESFVNYRYDAREGKVKQGKFDKKPKPKKDKKTGEMIPPPPRDPEKNFRVHDAYNLPVDWNFQSDQPLTLPAGQRAGILTQPSWLGGFATNNETHAIRRGKWIRERLLGGTVPDLPISVDAQLPDAPEKTMRERMEVTREDYCWNCHQKMNPLGLPFESFDYVGRFREKEKVLDVEATAENVDSKGKHKGDVFRGAPIDTTGMVDGTEPELEGPVKDAVSLMHRLADSPHVRQVFVRHAFRYWMGRNETLDDGSVLVRADNAYVENDGSFRALVVSLLTSDAFLYRK